MNIQDYIASGILEAYVLGDLTPEERAEVEQMVLTHPELRNVLNEIEETQERLLMQTGIAPESSLKQALFRKIEVDAESAKIVPLTRDGDYVWRYAAAASIVVALMAGGIAYYYWDQYNKVSTDLRSLVAQYQQMAQNYNRVNQDLETLSSEVAVLENPQFKRVVLNGTASAPDAMATVYWNEGTEEVYLRIQNMKQLARENQYQLWAIVDGKPVDAGVFDAGGEKLLKMKNIGSGAVTFAVTIEPRGGKPSPTLETMQVAGNVAKG